MGYLLIVDDFPHSVLRESVENSRSIKCNTLRMKCFAMCPCCLVAIAELI